MSSDTRHPLAAERSPNWLDELIDTARERGEFDDLPGHGEKLDLGPESSAPTEYDLAFKMLSNAGYAPHWVMLGQEADKLDTQLAEFRARASSEIAALRAELASAHARSADALPRQSWWSRLWRGSDELRSSAALPISAEAIERRRNILRSQHHELAEKLEAKIATYHAAMPRELWHAQRIRRTPEQWDAEFDAACPPADSQAIEMSQPTPP